MSPEIAAKLRTVLAQLYPHEPDIRRIASDAGLEEARIDFGSTAINDWRSVLTEAVKNDRVDALLAVVEGEYPNNQELREVCDAYRRSGRQSGQARGNDPVMPTVDLPDTENDSEAITQKKSKPLGQKSRVEATIIVALIGAFATIAVALIGKLPGISSPSATSVGSVTIVPEATDTITPMAAFLQTPLITPTGQVTGTSFTAVVPSTTIDTHLPVGIVQFLNCPDSQFASNLETQITNKMRAQKINTDTFVFKLPKATKEQIITQQEPDYQIIIWGECTNNKDIVYNAEFLAGANRAKYRIADLPSLSITWPLTLSQNMPIAILAGALSYFNENSSLDSSLALLHQESGQWSELKDMLQNIYLHFLLGNAYLGHSAHLEEDALIQYDIALKQIEYLATVKLRTDLAKQLYNNRGYAYLQQARYFNSISPPQYEKANNSYIAARTAFSTAIGLDQMYVASWIGRSETFIDSQDLDKILYDCTQALKIQTSAAAYTCRAREYFIAAEFYKAAEIAEESIRIDDHYAFAYYFGGRSYCGIHNTQKAANMLERFLTESASFARREGILLDTFVEIVNQNLQHIRQKGC